MLQNKYITAIQPSSSSSHPRHNPLFLRPACPTPFCTLGKCAKQNAFFEALLLGIGILQPPQQTKHRPHFSCIHLQTLLPVHRLTGRTNERVEVREEKKDILFFPGLYLASAVFNIRNPPAGVTTCHTFLPICIKTGRAALLPNNAFFKKRGNFVILFLLVIREKREAKNAQQRRCNTKEAMKHHLSASSNWF